MHEEQPNVICLALHLPKMHRVVFNPNDDVVNVLLRAKHERIMLIGFIIFCKMCNTCKCSTIYIFSIFSILCLEDYHKGMDT
jgi:hypothetical protein